MQHLQLQSLNGSVKDLNRSIRHLQQTIAQLNANLQKLHSNVKGEPIHRLRNLDEKMSEIENHLWQLKDHLL